MDKARLIRWLKELHGVKQGKNDSSAKFAEEVAARLNVSERAARDLDRLNDLIPDLQRLVDWGQLPQTVGTDLAQKFTPEQQQDLYDILGPEGISHLKASDIQSAARESQPSHTEAEIQAILNRVQA